VLAQHLLVFVLVIVFPLWDRYEIPRLKASTDPEKKVRFYRKVIAVEWVCALIALAAVGFGALFTIRTVPGEVGWLTKDSGGKAFLLGFAAAAAVGLALPAILAIFSETIRAKVAKATESLSYLLPSSRRERLWWWPLCITAGVCEEVLYRGFLLRYLHTFPFHFKLTVALAVAAVIFGIGHIYQGVKGAVATTALGFALGAVFLMTGSLVIPIVAHALLDLRILVLVPAGAVEGG
jgi:membrane protease YdiL (CAAX protease family)